MFHRLFWVRQAPGVQLPVQVQMNYNAAHFRKEVLVRLTLRASYYEKILRSAFPPPPDAFSPKPSLALSRIPATVLTSPWAGRQATLYEFVPQTAAGAFFRLQGGCTASSILQAEQMAEAALDACRIQNGRCKTGGISDEVLQPRREKPAGAAILCRARSYSRQSN